MKRFVETVAAVAALAALVGAQAAAQGGCRDYGSSEAPPVYRICEPEGTWNGDLVVFAHGYVAATEPVGIPESQLVLPDGTSIPDLVTARGYAFAATSYPENGLVIPMAVADVVRLVAFFEETVGPAERVLLTGGSEGGLVAVLGLERHPDVFDGGVAACGPIGSFRWQIQWVGDFRVLFDVFFPGVLPGSPVAIPPEVLEDWDAVYVPRILAALAADPGAAEQLLRVSRAAVDPGNPDSVAETVVGLLWYNIFGTNDAVERLGGQPFDNSRRWYFGSDNDWLLNWRVQRFRADPGALAALEAFETEGRPGAPLVTLHTTADPIVPYLHEPAYTFKTFRSGAWTQRLHLPVGRYGHCAFTGEELLRAFGLLAWWVGP
ncbi:MAG: alpha/beta hydrolase [Deferrisomatales bacterium]